ncbi:MAG TPA: hypothetical protein EYN54_12825, partial [Methylococcaceae bacterium]|nr:hypothetical protein [Methylococcaceae bacterium]
SIKDLARGIDIFTAIPFAEFVDQSLVAYGSDAPTTVNALNALFTGAGLGNLPVITSVTSINTTENVAINYEMTATGGVGYEWENLPAGIVTVEGNVRKLVGSIAADGVYTPTMKVVNYFGNDTETLTITVSNPPYSNTKSVNFNNNDYLNASALTSNPMYRAANGTGASDAWTICGWFKGGTSSDSNQTIISYGGTNKDDEGRVWVYWDGNSSKEQIVLKFGSEDDWLRFTTPDNSLVDNTWVHFIITYDGGTTGSNGGSINDYYSRFEIWLDGVSQTLTKENSNDGWDSSIKNEQFRIGEVVYGGKHMRNNDKVDEVAIWSSDQTANVAAIYNGGTTHDLSVLTTAPDNWWRMGDGDTFPTITDQISTLDFTMFNMTVGDIVNDTP